MKITVERTVAADEQARIYPYTARVEIESATKDQGRVYEVPVLVRHNGLSKTFFAELFGFGIETHHPQEMPLEIEPVLRGLINAARFPTYVFIARRARAIFPVYTIGDEVVAVTNEGPVFRHVELAKVRDYLTDFLHTAHILGEYGLSDKLHVRGISQHTLGLRRPVFYLKKRIGDGNDFWAPVFQATDGRSIYAYAANQRQEAARQRDEVLLLHQQVATALQHDNRLQNETDLRPDRLMLAYWERLEKTLMRVGETAVGPHTLPLYKNNSYLIALECRPTEERFGLYLGKNEQILIQTIQNDYRRRALL